MRAVFVLGWVNVLTCGAWVLAGAPPAWSDAPRQGFDPLFAAVWLIVTGGTAPDGSAYVVVEHAAGGDMTGQHPGDRQHDVGASPGFGLGPAGQSRQAEPAELRAFVGQRRIHFEQQRDAQAGGGGQIHRPVGLAAQDVQQGPGMALRDEGQVLAARVGPRGAVPFIGLAFNRPSCSVKNSSGEKLKIQRCPV